MAVSSSTRKKIGKKNATNAQRVVVDSLPTLEIPRDEVDVTSVQNMRTKRNPEDFDRLVASIRNKGIKQNPVVWQRDSATINAIVAGTIPGNPNCKYDLIFGFGRWQAAEIIFNETKTQELPRFATMRFGVIASDVPRQEAIELQFDENSIRENLSTEDEYRHIARLRESGKTLEQIANELQVSVRFLVQRCNFYEKAAPALVDCVREGIINFTLASEVQEKLGAGKPTPSDLESQEIVAKSAREAFENLWLKEAIAAEEANQTQLESAKDALPQEGKPSVSAKDALEAINNTPTAAKEGKKGKPKGKPETPKDSTIARKTSGEVKAALAAQLAKKGNKKASPERNPKSNKFNPPWTFEETNTAVAIISKRKPDIASYERGVYETLRAILRIDDPNEFMSRLLNPMKPSTAESALASAIKNAKQEAANVLALTGK